MSLPGRILSAVYVSEGDGARPSAVEVANTIHGDRDSIDGILLTSEDGDAGAMPGIHSLIRDIRPPHMPVYLVTAGRDPRTVEDLVGAGYADCVAVRLDGRPSKEQLESMDAVVSNRAKLFVEVVLDRSRIDAEGVLSVADAVRGYEEFVLRVPAPPAPAFGKRELNALVKALRPRARNVRVLDVGRRRDPGPLPGWGPCCRG